MLSLSDTDIEYTMSELSRHGLEAGYLVPTATGLSKGILDAHDSLRVFLRLEGIHDFRQQGQGEKVILPADLRTSRGVAATYISMYRPNTKNGDPRIWIYGLGKVVEPGNLLAILPPLDGRLQILLISQLGLDDVGRPETPIGEAVHELAGRHDAPAAHLLQMLRQISSQGYVPSLRPGDTGIGYTLETMLGIPANSSRAPDYRGIEIKAARTNAAGEGKNRVNLFAKTPDWKSSRLTSAHALLKEFGYIGTEGLLRLYVTVRNTPNAQGLHFALSNEEVLACGATNGGSFSPAVLWPLGGLRSALLSKHRETFWVKASARVVDGREEFHYRHVVHSREPLASNFAPLILNGTVSMDFTVKQKPDGRLRDHGYLFKIFPESRHLLIPNEVVHSLTAS